MIICCWYFCFSFERDMHARSKLFSRVESSKITTMGDNEMLIKIPQINGKPKANNTFSKISDDLDLHEISAWSANINVNALQEESSWDIKSMQTIISLWNPLNLCLLPIPIQRYSSNLYLLLIYRG